MKECSPWDLLYVGVKGQVPIKDPTTVDECITHVRHSCSWYIPHRHVGLRQPREGEVLRGLQQTPPPPPPTHPQAELYMCTPFLFLLHLCFNYCGCFTDEFLWYVASVVFCPRACWPCGSWFSLVRLESKIILVDFFIEHELWEEKQSLENPPYLYAINSPHSETYFMSIYRCLPA